MDDNEKQIKDEDLEQVDYKPNPYKRTETDEGYADEYGHVWTLGWQECDRPHPGFGGTMDIYGGYVDICINCGMYGYEFKGPSKERPGKYELQRCGKKIRSYE